MALTTHQKDQLNLLGFISCTGTGLDHPDFVVAATGVGHCDMRTTVDGQTVTVHTASGIDLAVMESADELIRQLAVARGIVLP